MPVNRALLRCETSQTKRERDPRVTLCAMGCLRLSGITRGSEGRRHATPIERKEQTRTNYRPPSPAIPAMPAKGQRQAIEASTAKRRAQSSPPPPIVNEDHRSPDLLAGSLLLARKHAAPEDPAHEEAVPFEAAYRPRISVRRANHAGEVASGKWLSMIRWLSPWQSRLALFVH